MDTGEQRQRSGGRMIRVKVLLFARFAELLGATEMEVDVGAPATVRTLLDSLRTLTGGAQLPPTPMVARNRIHAQLDTALEDGDEVAVLPPLAGG
jgi:molybdopterin converting factor small subunit